MSSRVSGDIRCVGDLESKGEYNQEWVDILGCEEGSESEVGSESER